MAEEKQPTETAGKWTVSRRDFLKDAGLIVGGATIGSIALAGACKTTTETVTTTVATGGTVTTTAPGATSTVTNTITTTVTQPGTGPGIIDSRTVFNVNDKEYKVDIQPYWSLSHVLRECLGLTALKIGCDRGECGHCTVLVNGKAVYSCLTLAIDATAPDNKVETAESLSEDKINLKPIAKTFLDDMAYQCGFCTAGFMMSAKALLADIQRPTMADVQEGLSGHMCVCSAIKRVCETVHKLGGGA